MGFAQAGVVAGEGKAVTSDQPRAGEKAATRQEALIRRPEKTVVGERTGEAFSAPDCDVQYRACRWWARLRIGSLGTIFFVPHYRAPANSRAARRPPARWMPGTKKLSM